MVQWLGLGAFNARTWVQSLVGELRSHKLCGEAKKKKKGKRKERKKISSKVQYTVTILLGNLGTQRAAIRVSGAAVDGQTWGSLYVGHRREWEEKRAEATAQTP